MLGDALYTEAVQLMIDPTVGERTWGPVVAKLPASDRGHFAQAVGAKLSHVARAFAYSLTVRGDQYRLTAQWDYETLAALNRIRREKEKFIAGWSVTYGALSSANQRSF